MPDNRNRPVVFDDSMGSIQCQLGIIPVVVNIENYFSTINPSFLDATMPALCITDR